MKWKWNLISLNTINLVERLCVCVSLLIQSFRFHLEITQWLYILSLGVDFIWFSLPYSRSAVRAQLNEKKWERERRSSFFDIDHIEMSAFILLLTPFSFFEPYFHNWMSFLFIAAFLFAIVAAVVVGDIRFFFLHIHTVFSTRKRNESNRIGARKFTYDFFLFEDDSFSNGLASVYFARCFCSVTFEHIHVFEA